MNNLGKLALAVTVTGLLIGVAIIPAAAQSTAPDTPAAAATLPLAGKKLRVAVRFVPPFVFLKDDKPTGFSLDLWNALAKATGAETDLQIIDTLPHILDSVKAQQSDLAIYSISITAKRELDYDFSQPMFDAGLQVAVRAGASSNSSMAMGTLFQSFLTGPILNLLALLAFLILIPAHLVWIFERNHPKSELVSKPYFPGIFKAMWWATGAAGGQQLDYPHSPFGKVISALSVFTSVIFVAYFTAAVTSAMTVNQLKGDIAGPEDLPGRRVGVVAGSTSAAVVQGIGAKTTDFPAYKDALEALGQSKIDAVVYDAPVLLYYAAHDGKGKVQVVGTLFHRENYGILFPPGSPLRKPINEALLELRESGGYDALFKKWFSSEGGG